ncbi:MAG: type I methionyl aminopeptidase [Candidatus Omnitrophica bacterium]|nr:type I methionyl aminopeptidase [Candidatus Omnitrophota bacterium]
MTVVTDKRDIEKIRESGKIIREIFEMIVGKISDGISTAEIDRIVEEFIILRGAKPAFKGYRGFPAATCVSPNEVVVHGIPSKNIILRQGDIVSVDVGVEKNGFFTDAARTFSVGKISEEANALVRATKKALSEGIKAAVAGNRISDISFAVESVAKREGLKEVRMFVGHGIGRQLHEAPEVPNWGEPGRGLVLKEGLLLAIEPMFNIGTREVKIRPDGWTAVTADGELSAHFEDTVIVGKEKAEILT